MGLRRAVNNEQREQGVALPILPWTLKTLSVAYTPDGKFSRLRSLRVYTNFMWSIKYWERVSQIRENQLEKCMILYNKGKTILCFKKKH